MIEPHCWKEIGFYVSVASYLKQALHIYLPES